MFRYLALLAACFAVSGCKKNASLPCKSNCIEIHISGDLRAEPGNTALGDVPVTILLKNPDCLFCTSTEVTSQKTDAGGKFDFRFSFDSTLFGNHNLAISVPGRPGYISIPDESGGLNVMQDINPFDAG